MLPYADLKDIDKACQRLAQAFESNERILIIGDFDADGATATALGVSALRALGAKQVDFLVPNRFEFGYGLTPAIVALARTRDPGLIITVDNGITSIEGVEAANQAGIDVLITDHHLPGDALPKAVAIVNPNQEGDCFASKAMAGVGVIFYLSLALRAHLQASGWFESQQIPKPNMAQFLDLVALGTVADVVPLDQNNRILVKQGVQRIKKGQARPGIAALIHIAGREASKLRESDLGFAVAPRLNAAGRLDDMSLGIECLLAEEEPRALVLAKQLDELNQERRKIETTMKEQALAELNKLSLHVESTAMPAALCLFEPSFHQGVIGILAGRLKEQYFCPVWVFAQVSDAELKGSARSIPGLNIRDLMATVDKNHPGLIIKFGGHAMAAGMSLALENLSAFRQAITEEVALQRLNIHHDGSLLSDGSLNPKEMNEDLARGLENAGPWGQMFPEPVFDNVFEVLEQRLVGQKHLKLSLCLPGQAEVFDAIAFQVDLKCWPNHRVKYIHGVYKLEMNSFQGRSRLQLQIVGLQARDAY